MRQDPEPDMQSRDAAGILGSSGNRDTGISLASWSDWESIARDEEAQDMRQLVDTIFREQVMGGLALLLIPILALLDFVQLPLYAVTILSILDVAIWVFFILEYTCRLSVAKDRIAYLTSPWNILYLVIISVPAIALVAGTGFGISRYFRVLRVMQAFQVLVVGGKTVSRHISGQSSRSGVRVSPTEMQVRSRPLARSAGSQPSPLPESSWSPVKPSDTTGPLNRHGLWVDLSGLSPSDLPALSRISSVPEYILAEKLREHAFPRADPTGKTVTIFLKIPRLSRDPEDRRRWQVFWDGLLIAYDQDFVMTFARTAIPVIDRIPSMGTLEKIPVTGSGIVYLVVRDALDTIEGMILTAEEQIVFLEAQPMDRLPSNFLNMMYSAQKELSRTISWLSHTKTALEAVCGGGRWMSGTGDAETGRLRSLVDRCSLLSDNAQNASDSFTRMVDFYLNMTSFSMNRVMKMLAVLTALTMVPTLVGGLLGMNLVDNPWPATLLQMVTAVALLMVLMAWVYFNFGWLRR